MNTYFAPAQRTEKRKFKNQIVSISHNPIMDTLLKTAAGLLVVLNEDRQILAVNHSFLEKLGVKDIDEVLGFRLGESLHCIHSHAKPNGCGTTEYCMSCGAAIAMMTAIDDDKPDQQICALVTDKNKDIADTCLLIQACPIKLDGDRWILIYAKDITKERLRANLEQVFYHDMNNILTGVYGSVQLLEMSQPKNQEIVSLRTGIERLKLEVQMQKIFSRQEEKQFHVTKTCVTLNDIKREVHLIISGHKSSFKKKLIEKWPTKEIAITTDPLLTSRILGNMIINAFEACDTDDSIGVTTHINSKSISWEVKNKSYIRPEIQKRIFQKHFSTKSGMGRGLGTYSMKLFGENYLNGQVFFSSSKKNGTLFTFQLPR